MMGAATLCVMKNVPDGQTNGKKFIQFVWPCVTQVWCSTSELVWQSQQNSATCNL